MSHAFISRVAAQVSLPYRRQEEREIVKRNGSLEVHFSTNADCLPYGKYPRLFELWACTMIKTHDECWDPTTRTLHIGKSFRDFLDLLNIRVGGRQLKTIKPQLERLFRCSYSVINLSGETTTDMLNFVVAPKVHIEWLSNERPLRNGETADNFVVLSEEYVRMLQDNPVPVDLPTIAKIKSPLVLDIYWWLTKRYYGMHDRVDITWDQIYSQFGSGSSEMWKFRQTFKRAVKDAVKAYPQARITCGRTYVTLYPSATSVPTVGARRHEERQKKRVSRGKSDEGHWQDIRGWGQVYTTRDLFQVDQARNHLDGTTPMDDCLYCAYDEQNRQFHGFRVMPR